MGELVTHRPSSGSWPAFRLPFAPVTNYPTIAFLVVVFCLSWFDVPAGRIMIYGSPGVAVPLVIGWYAVRTRVRDLASQDR